MFRIELKERAIKDLKSMPKQDAQRVVQKIKVLENGLS
jgi:mRNA interferase RelE/StbE